MRIQAICITVLATCGACVAQAADIRTVTVHEGATGTRAEIALSAPAEYKLIHLHGPDRLVVDMPASSLSKSVALPSGVGVVGRVRSGQPVSGTARLVFDLAVPVAALAPRIEHGPNGPTLVIEWPGDGNAGAPAPKPAAVVVAKSPAPVTAADIAAPAPIIRDDAAQAVASAEATSKLVAAMRGPVVPAATASAGTQPRTAASNAGALKAPVPAIGKVVTRTASPTPPSSVVAPTRAASAAAPSAVSGRPGIAAVVETPTVTPLPGRVATGVPTRVATGVPTATATSSLVTAPVLPPAQVSRQRGTRSLVIAIDPGHGGQDPGAVGLNGNREKDVTLAISRELARQINATPGLKAFLTRDADMYIPLGNRARLARGAKADMFISIHADAAENRNARGSSVYVLSLKGASSQRARWLADKENRSDLIGGARYKQADTTLTSVLLDLTQSGHMRASEDAGTEILSGLKRIGNHHKPHIERANFAVLRTSDMPSMLVETAFISNPEEEARLVDPAFQRQLARAVLDGVDTYFKRQPPPGTLYAARESEMTFASTGKAP